MSDSNIPSEETPGTLESLCNELDAVSARVNTLFDEFCTSCGVEEESKDLFTGSIMSVLEIMQELGFSSQGQTNATDLIAGVIAEIDKRISAQLNLIIHSPAFLTLEGAWRGLHFLVVESPRSREIKIRVLNISKKDIQRTLRKYPGVTWDQSPLFKLIYEYEFGTAGGEPFGCIIGDYYFDESPAELELLNGMARIASAAHAPFITGASPAIMNMESWRELANPRNYTRIFNSNEYVKWRAFRERSDSRYIVLTLPRILARIPYGSRTRPVDGLDFEENVGAGISNGYCWMNAAYAAGININKAFMKYGWCVRICGYMGGRVEHLPVEDYPEVQSGMTEKCPLEIAITDQRETELSQNGFLVLSYLKNSSYAVFMSGQTVYKARTFSSLEATRNEELSTQLPCLFAVSRFAHYIKCILRDKIGSFTNSNEIEVWLNDWISMYVTGDPEAPDEIKAKYPLSSAKINLVPRINNPGHYDVEIFLCPHYQLDGVTIALKLSSQVPGRIKQ